MPPLTVTRRASLRAAAVAGAAALALSACGGSPAGTTPPAASAAPAAEAAFPVTVKDRFGSATISAAPRRVVAAGYNEADFLLAFGVVPVGVRDFIGDFPEESRPWAQGPLGGATPVNIGDEIDFEKVATLEPDLIVGPYSFVEKADYDKLTAIAPTVGPVTEDGNIGWQDETTIIGQALGQPEKAREIVAATEKVFADTKAAHPQWQGKKLAVVFADDDITYVLDPTDPRAEFFTKLGFAPPSFAGDVGAEQARLLDQDVIVVMDAPRERFTANRLYADLKVVKEGRAVFIGGFGTPFAGALGFGSPLSFPFAIENIAPRLDKATDGDPNNPTD